MRCMMKKKIYTVWLIDENGVRVPLLPPVHSYRTYDMTDVGCNVEVTPYEGQDFDKEMVALLTSYVPDTATPLQIKKALKELELLEQVIAFVKDKGELSDEYISWYDATVFERSNPLIQSAKEELGLTDELVNNIFRKAHGG
jgi:hypothetical protein